NLMPAALAFLFRCNDGEHAVSATPEADGWRLDFGDRPCLTAAQRRPDGCLLVALDGVMLPLRVLEHGSVLAVFAGGESWEIEEIDLLAPPADAEIGAGRLTAPMPGRVAQLLVAAGDRVRR